MGENVGCSSAMGGSMGRAPMTPGPPEEKERAHGCRRPEAGGSPDQIPCERAPGTTLNRAALAREGGRPDNHPVGWSQREDPAGVAGEVEVARLVVEAEVVEALERVGGEDHREVGAEEHLAPPAAGLHVGDELGR